MRKRGRRSESGITVREAPPPCGTCGRPSTHGVRDVALVSEPTDVIEHYELRGKPRWGCDDHPVESRELDERPAAAIVTDREIGS